MDTRAIISSLIRPDGTLALPETMTLATLAEMLYAKGDTSALALGFHDVPNDELRTYTRAEVNTRVKAVAARLQQIAEPGTRVALLAGNSPEYLFSFLGALYASMVPIPLYDPRERGHEGHLKAVFEDAEPQIVLTNRLSAPAVLRFFGETPAHERARVIVVDKLPDSLSKYWKPTQGSINDPVFLQYTSGSTRRPAGVILTNRTILYNVLQTYFALEVKTPLRMVTWLPMHHDMGMIVVVLAALLGEYIDLMTPQDFVQDPSRWTNTAARRGDDDVFTWSVLPNFALELLATRGRPTEGQDFSNLGTIIVGSEPVTERAINAFKATFEPYGIDPHILYPSYGLAEAAMLVAAPQRKNQPLVSHFDREALEAGRAELTDVAEGYVAVTSNGQSVPIQGLTIVDPETKAELADGVVGEIWVNGGNLANGYFGQGEGTDDTFNQVLGERLAEGSRVEKFPNEGWLATGDLGAFVDGEFYITGRIKDMVVIAGRNHYPQDIEGTVQNASDHVRVDSVAAFSIPGDEVEKLVIFAERADGATEAGDEEAIAAIRSAVAAAHGITPEVIEMRAPGEIKRSASGKIARRVNRNDFLAR